MWVAMQVWTGYASSLKLQLLLAAWPPNPVLLLLHGGVGTVGSSCTLEPK